MAPEYHDDEVVILPMYAALYWPMGTPAGFATFSDPRVNAHFKRILDQWSSFLRSPDSRYVLTTDEHGWFGPSASKKMADFEKTFVCDPAAEYHGFNSWDDFFTRQFRPGVRPVAAPDNDSVITNACEASVYRIAQDIKATDRFWMKGEPYSLHHMLNQDPLIESAVIFGRGRFQCGVLVQPSREHAFDSSDTEKLIQYRKGIW